MYPLKTVFTIYTVIQRRKSLKANFTKIITPNNIYNRLFQTIITIKRILSLLLYQLNSCLDISEQFNRNHIQRFKITVTHFANILKIHKNNFI